MAEITKKSRMGVKKETTENSLIAPANANDYIPLREGFSLELAFETLESDEIRASIGKSKDAVGAEAPTASIPLYLKHSGVEGQAPKAGVSALYESAYGALYVASTEYDTTAGSTTTAINVGVGEGAQFKVGQAILVKHAAFPHEIAVIKDISGDVLEPLFALSNAPATGTNLGKAVHYNAEQDAIPSLSLHDYRANGGAYQAVAGGRVTSLEIAGSSGEFITADVSIEGLTGYFNPITIASADRYIDFNETGPTLRAAQVATGVYKTPQELAQAIQDAMNAVATDVITVTYSDTTGKFTIATDGTLLELLWNSGANTANTIGDKIGFSTAADDTGALTYTSDNELSYVSPHTPSFDDVGNLIAKNNRVMIGFQSNNVCFSTQEITYTLDVPKTDVLSICAESGKSGSVRNARTVSVSLTANLSKHDSKLFDAMAKNKSVSFQWNFGEKSGQNWVPGKSGVVHVKDAVVTAVTLGDTDGLVTMAIEITGHVDADANSETALNLL